MSHKTGSVDIVEPLTQSGCEALGSVASPGSTLCQEHGHPHLSTPSEFTGSNQLTDYIASIDCISASVPIYLDSWLLGNRSSFLPILNKY